MRVFTCTSYVALPRLAKKHSGSKDVPKQAKIQAKHVAGWLEGLELIVPMEQRSTELNK